MRAAVQEASDLRPVFDSEHGPIHRFKDKKQTLPEAFDDEYFRHIQWAHLASGGAGGGMRWPNRHPHVLTSGMRAAQKALAGFLPLIDWTRFTRRNLNDELMVSARSVARFGCGDDRQAIVWLLRTDTLTRSGTLAREAPELSLELSIPSLLPGRYRVTCFDTLAGRVIDTRTCRLGTGERDTVALPLRTDLALAVCAAEGNPSESRDRSSL
jgi:mannan endo-1,4-beta-mannosidase